jgi:hypothetical protein
MKRAAAFLAAAVAVIAGGAWLFSAIESIPLGDGFYWAVETGTTVGYGDVTPHNAAGRAVAVVVMLLAIPLFGGVFAMLTAAHVHKRVDAGVGERVAAAEKRIAEEADKRHVIMQRHIERVVAGHCADVMHHVSVVADGPARGGAGSNPAKSEGLPAEKATPSPGAAGPVVPPPATTSPKPPATRRSTPRRM